MSFCFFDNRADVSVVVMKGAFVNSKSPFRISRIATFIGLKKMLIVKHMLLFLLPVHDT